MTLCDLLKMIFSSMILLISGAFFLTTLNVSASEKIILCFYSSETNINNFKSLKMEFDSYLSKFGPYEFQPFNDRESFEHHIKEGKKNQLLFLSSWHYNRIYKEYLLKPFLVGMRNGKDYQKRILVATPKFANMDAVKAGPVASASNIQHTRSELDAMFGKKGIAESTRILPVPKDVDALMSVGFDMARAALITENALNDLKMLDPLLYEKMKVLAEGKAGLLLILAAPKDFVQDTDQVIQIIKKMPNDPDGKNIIKMLDLDGWKTVNSSDSLNVEG
jgi:hypothetical protein